MLRLRVWRLYQPLTLLGLELWQLFLGAVAMTLGLQVGGALPHPALGLVLAGLLGFLAIKFSDRLRILYPGASLWQEIAWLTQKERYRPERDEDTTPLIYDERFQR
ncbi:hypothetical protein [Thermus thermophilus]|uniref:Uncharacterized protein n=1 Tax=Thermus thermophilus (strain SG0.5JP17-16) TaxID=762633 RepID=F6DJ15_THETG|nr:hypothetical protein [Thermus thermophilus]AEG34412.1 hypothetical protein Ththe16_2023 [Thermus thermophilus SG0.5JP17-16]BCZ90780.1 hypothetical protein TthAA22_25850 [Thermus thermophilus]BDG18852.1 hypothetical protein TthSNM11_10550 [Thermus thermophilus]